MNEKAEQEREDHRARVLSLIGGADVGGRETHEMTELKHPPRIIYLQAEDPDDCENWYATWDRMNDSDYRYIRADAYDGLVTALEQAEQTVRNLGNGALSGEWKQIALNEAENIRKTLAGVTT